MPDWSSAASCCFGCRQVPREWYSILSSGRFCLMNLDWLSSEMRSLSRLASCVWVCKSNLNWGFEPVCLAAKYWKKTPSFKSLVSLPGGALRFSSVESLFWYIWAKRRRIYWNVYSLPFSMVQSLYCEWSVSLGILSSIHSWWNVSSSQWGYNSFTTHCRLFLSMLEPARISK